MRRKKSASNWDSKTLDVPAAAGQAVKVVAAGDRIRQVVDDVVRRRQAGEFVADNQIIAENAELMPELADELRTLEEIRRAFLAAQKAGPINEPLKILSMNELEAPITDDDASSDLDDAIRVRISGYTITDEVNHGGQATVYKAIQDSTGRKVAIKVVYGVHSRARVRIDREAEILVALDHPNVVGILDRGRTADGSFFIAMDFVEGYALDEFLEVNCASGPATLDDLIQLFIKTCHAVGYAHEKGVLHRDLKPSNIRVDLRGEPHILDFGLARLIHGNDLDGVSQHSITASGQLVGSLPWCSPEQAAGKQDEITIRSDVYALGLMLYQAIAGEAPYSNRGLINEVVNNILNAVPKPLAGREFSRWGTVSEKLESIVLRCLEKSPENRFASATELATALEDYVREPSSVLPYRSSRKIERRSPVRVNKWSLSAVTVLIAFIIVMAIQMRNGTQRVNGRPIFKNDLGMTFVYCPPGNFEMGLRPGDPDYSLGTGAHTETISRGFYISTLEVTQAQYAQLMGDRLSPERYPGPNLPMGSARWIDAREFCKRLSALTHKRYRMPTEVEWEYACRAGSTGNFGGSPNLTDVGWYKDNSPPDSMPQGGTKQPNAWKIYDMHGSVWEWCDSDYESYDPAFKNRMGKIPSKVYRGGDIRSRWELCRAGNRSSQHPEHVIPALVGIRVVLEAEDVK